MLMEKFLVLGFCLPLVQIIAFQTFSKDVIKKITVDTKKDCGKQNSCKNMTSCDKLGICGNACRSERIKYPTLRKLIISEVSKVNVNSDAITLKFDIQGNCDNCTFLTMEGENSLINFSIQGERMMIDDKFNISVNSSTPLIFRFLSGKGYIENKTGIFSTQNITSVSLVSDLDKNIILKEVDVYDDVLTSREIDGNNTDTFCRCPPEYPEYMGSSCFKTDRSRSEPRLLNSNSFYGINEALLDNTNSKWTSTDTDNVIITIELYDVYQIEEIKIRIEETTPSTVIWEILTGLTWTNMVDRGLFRHNITNSTLVCTRVDQQNQTSASGKIIRITLNGTMQEKQNDTDQYIISGIDLKAKCACRGIAAGCSADENKYYQTYTCQNCSSEQKRNTPPCNSCQEDLYLDDGRCRMCLCNKNGTQKCDESGRCICKIGVTGVTCDKCIEENSACNRDPCNCTLPKITFSPSYGPESGGTLVTLTGRNITITPEVLFANTKQDIISSTSTQIIFKTTKSTVGEHDIVLRWRQSTWITSPFVINLKRFSLRPDPVLSVNNSKSLLTATTGCKLRFRGQNLDSVFSPKLTFLISEKLNNTTTCEVSEKKEVTCSMIKLDETRMVTVLLDMECPSCSETYNVTFRKPNLSLPKLDVDYTHPFVKEITVHGSNFEACETNEVEITIGGEICTINHFSDSSITCEPPTSAPDEKVVYEVQLKIGDERFIAGTITYRTLVKSIYFIYIMVGLGAFVLLLLVILITICFWKKRSTNDPSHERAVQNSYTFPMTNPLHVEPQPSFDDIKRAFLSKLDHSLKSDVEQCLLPVGSFTINRPAVCIASGDKARMIEGNLTKDNSKIHIKDLRNDLPEGVYPKYVATALKECTRFRKMQDSNILTIIGIAVENNKFHILYPYMRYRTLKAHVSDNNQEFSLKQLTVYGSMVIDGMIYLSENGIYHRDLAARNCMVQNGGSVKISDGSFSFDFYPTEYMHDKAKHRYLPVRWMAPESLLGGFYDSKSDVWAFGVLFWEILTRGCLPFVDTRDSDIQKTIEEGYRLGNPEFVPENIYVLMNTCWEEISDLRPTFEELNEKFNDILGEDPNTSTDYVNMDRSNPSESIYQNSVSFKRKTLPKTQ